MLEALNLLHQTPNQTDDWNRIRGRCTQNTFLNGLVRIFYRKYCVIKIFIRCAIIMVLHSARFLNIVLRSHSTDAFQVRFVRFYPQSRVRFRYVHCEQSLTSGQQRILSSTPAQFKTTKYVSACHMLTCCSYSGLPSA